MNSKALKPIDPQENDEVIFPEEDEDVPGGRYSIEESRMHIGPIPSPEVLAEYNQIDPSFANRILVMAEQQALHRQGIEKKIVDSGTKESLLGVICGFIIGMTALIVSLILGLNGRTIESSLLGVGGLVGLVSVFIYGTRSKIKEDNDDK